MISEDLFKSCMRQLPSPVYIATVEKNGLRDGLTATSVCSVTIEPPSMLVCVNKQASACSKIKKLKKFSLHALSENQQNIADCFGGMDGTEGEDRFSKYGSWGKFSSSMPILEEALFSFDCIVNKDFEISTHIIFTGMISEIIVRKSKSLLYKDGKYGKFAI